MDQAFEPSAVDRFFATETRNVDEFQAPGLPKLAKVDGKVCPTMFKPENIRSGKQYSARNDDIFICTYPKCGTTWAQYICVQLLSKEPPCVGRELALSPMLEAYGRGPIECLDSPRLIKTHYEFDECPKSDKAKYIYVARNPKDCLVSSYHQHLNMKCYNWQAGSFDAFFDLFLAGRLDLGDYWSHLLGWMPHFADENVLLIKYEDMIRDLAGVVTKIGSFLGGGASSMVNDPDILAEIVKTSTFDSMKEAPAVWFPQEHMHKNDFLRKGTTRDWVGHMTEQQSDLIDKHHRSLVAGTVAEIWWRSEMAYPEV